MAMWMDMDIFFILLQQIDSIFVCLFRCNIRKLKHSVVSTLPVLYWLPKYSIWDYGMPDLVSGISVGIMHLPQGINTLYSYIFYRVILNMEEIYIMFSQF